MTRAAPENLNRIQEDDVVSGAAQASGKTTAVSERGGRSSYRETARKVFNFPRELFAPLILLGLATIGLFFWTISRMWERWNNTHGYYSHGPLILPIACMTAWLIVRNRGLPMKSTRGSRAVGLILLIGALLMHLASMYARVTFVSGFMALPILAGIALYLGGWVMLERLWFPIAFLAFMIPLPDPAIGDINFRLKIFAAQGATELVNILGVPAYLRGAEIFLAGGRALTVEDACSGLRSLIALLAFATLFTYACKLRGYKRLMLLLAAVPIAVAANVVRIVTLTIVANTGRLDLVTPGGWVHDGMGYVVFVVAFCMKFLIEELIDLLPGAKSAKWLGLSGGKSEARSQ
jgi:exosortase